MEKPEIKEAIVSLDTDQIVNFISEKLDEAFDEGHEEAYLEHAAPDIDPEDDTEAGIAFCIKELKKSMSWLSALAGSCSHS
jgi:hypothetical protein